jgi:hypothetical protein
VEHQDINRNSEPGMIISEVAYTQSLLIILYFIYIYLLEILELLGAAATVHKISGGH